MSADIKELVETSNNVARVIVKDGRYKNRLFDAKSSVESSKVGFGKYVTCNF